MVLEPVSATLPNHLPIPSSETPLSNLLESLRDGVVLGYTIHALNASTITPKSLHHSIDLSQLGRQYSKSLFEVNENLNQIVHAAAQLKSISVVNLGSADILDRNVDIVLGLVWQLVRAHLLRDVNLVSRPELIRLLLPGESLKDLLKLSSEQLLVRWVNYHLARAGSSRCIANFGQRDIGDAEVYLELLGQICPRSVDRSQLEAAVGMDPADRASAVLDIADQIGCRRFVTAKDIQAGQTRLNLAFTASLFNEYIGIHLPSDDEVKALMNKLEDLEAENDELKQAVMERDAEMLTLLAEVEKLKTEWMSRDTLKSDDIKRQIDQLNQQHRQELEDVKAKATEEMEQRETEIRAMMDALKAKSKQAVMQAERQSEKIRAQVTRDLNNIKRSLQDFLVANDMLEPSSGEPEVTPFEQVTPLLKEHLVKVLESYYEKADEVKGLEKRVNHMEQVNNVIGTKISEYAETMIDGKKKQRRKHAFGLF
jgi:hypothetical protein